MEMSRPWFNLLHGLTKTRDKEPIYQLTLPEKKDYFPVCRCFHLYIVCRVWIFWKHWQHNFSRGDNLLVHYTYRSRNTCLLD